MTAWVKHFDYNHSYFRSCFVCTPPSALQPLPPIVLLLLLQQHSNTARPPETTGVHAVLKQRQV